MLAGIGGEVRAVPVTENLDSRRRRASQEALLGEDDDETQAQVLVAAIGQWRLRAMAINGGGVSRVSVVLGISRKTEGERERGSRGRRERRSTSTLSTRRLRRGRAGRARTELCVRAVATGEMEKTTGMVLLLAP